MREAMIARTEDVIATVPRVSLMSLPTPLESLAGLSEDLGLQVLIKRDDLTGLGAGGNKLRKLEFLVAEARRIGADTLLTTGGVQSNHARLTAAVAARCGLSCELFLKGAPPAEMTGNLLLNRLFGARMEFCATADYADIYASMDKRAAELASAGRCALIIPLGGATALGTLGYVLGAREIFEQLDPISAAPPMIVAAGGTGSTAAGLFLGAALWRPGTKILVVSASWSATVLENEIQRHVDDVATLLGLTKYALSEVIVDDSHVGPGYTRATAEAACALSRLARRDGVLLDMTYTAKAMSGCIARAKAGGFDQSRPIVFLHSGGTPEIFTRTGDELGFTNFRT